MLPAPLSFHDAPTAATLAAARTALAAALDNASTLAARIGAAEEDLARIVREARAAIEDMQREKGGLEETVVQTRAYLSPIRRMPGELLRELFLWCFEDHPCCAWVLSAVCSNWRRQALAIPRIWSKIRLFTNQRSSPDTIRLWLERSGASVPLDIEIYLRVLPPSPSSPSSALSAENAYAARRRGFAAASSNGHPILAPHPPPLFSLTSLGGGGGAVSSTALHFTPSVTPIIVPHAVAHPHPLAHAPHPLLGHAHGGGWDSPPPMLPFSSMSGEGGGMGEAHWGHIAVYYLVAQMHRWERFVFRFDRPFGSIAALKSIVGPSPLLREFEVSCASASVGAYPPDWSWLPTSTSSPTFPASSAQDDEPPPPLPSLTTLTLQHAPFTPTAPLFTHPRTHLTHLTLRALPSSPHSTAAIPLDRILGVVTANAATIRCLKLHFSAVANPVLPILPPLPAGTPIGAPPPAGGEVELPALVELTLGGHPLLAQLLDAITTPALDALELDFDAIREPLEEAVGALCSRSGGTSWPLRVLSIAYDAPPSAHHGHAHGGFIHPAYGYGGAGAGGPVGNWAFLGEVGERLEVLKVGGALLEPLATVLAAPEDGGGVPPMLPPNSAANVLNNGMNGGANGWACPRLRELWLRGCHGVGGGHGHGGHGVHAHEALGKLVRMVEGRNPETAAAQFPLSSTPASSSSSSFTQPQNGAVTRLTHLELDECVPLGPDVRSWLESRLPKGGVRCVEPPAPALGPSGMGGGGLHGLGHAHAHGWGAYGYGVGPVWFP
ncbi:hypothetical protein C8R46DRAFT_1020114 [Mycena filopes]|nr:hypothetical protein C8R46DRAFT_1020114 [Mycena filopes]